MKNNAENILASLRPTREEEHALFDTKPTHEEHWWGMPRFEMKDASPGRTLSVNFMTPQDFDEFCNKLGVKLSGKADSMWFPTQQFKPGEYYYDGPKTDSRYPICIPSKGRAAYQKTGKALDRMGVSYRFFVEQHEYEAYCAAVGESRVVSMPFSNLGQGSIPARNFIWDWARDQGYKRHWTVDDNIGSFARCHQNRRLCVYGGGFFNAMEDFVDRYTNVAMAGPHHKGFVPDRESGLTPFLFNSRVYSCILLDTTMDYRWRGMYNEDTDLSLRILKDNKCTLLFRALLMDKGPTSGSRSKATPGGNTDTVYATNDHRLEFARSLARQHPDCVEVVWKFNRWHHQVDYSAFEKNKPILRPGVVPRADSNDYGMVLVRKSEEEAKDVVDQVPHQPAD
jgi:hypothetical protein